MNRRYRQSVTFWFVVLVLLGYSANANEIRVRTQCECPGSVVLLGDIAEVLGDDAERLQRIELLPAPLPGTVRVLRLAELKRLLDLHNVDVQSTRLIGREVQISKADTPQVHRQTGHLKSVSTQPLPELVQHAVVDHLRQHADETAAWQVQVALTPTAPRVVPSDWKVEVSGGQAPWTGEQAYQVALVDGYGRRQNVTAEISVQRAVLLVVTRHPLRRGDVIREVDVELQPAARPSLVSTGLQSIDDAVGMELLRDLDAGQTLSATAVRKPILVKRREIIAVYARVGGVRVRTTAMALAEGSHGDLIELQALDRDARFMARVVGKQLAEVFAQGSSVSVVDRNPGTQTK